MSENKNKINVCFLIENKIKEKLKSYSREHGMSQSWIVQKSLEKYLETQLEVKNNE